MNSVSSKKLLCYFRINRDSRANAGVVQKCHDQIAAFRQLGWEVDVVWLSHQGVLWNDQLIHAFSFHPEQHRRSLYWFYWFHLENLVWRLLHSVDYELFFLRYPLTHPGFLKLLRKAKSLPRPPVVILEFPTFPYDQEKQRHSGFLRWVLAVDRLLRARLKKYVDLALHYGAEPEVLGIPTLPVRNSIDPTRLPLRQVKPQPNCLRLLAVGQWSYWHGLDRLLYGLAAYYQNPAPEVQVELRVVGEGPALSAWKELAQSLNLSQYVRFFPAAVGDLLDRCFDEADLGVGTLGLFRKGLALDSSLKHRDYCARGLPFFLASEDPDFPKTSGFVHYVPSSEEPIAISELVAFHHQIQSLSPEAIRSYALARLSWIPHWQRLAFRLNSLSSSG